MAVTVKDTIVREVLGMVQQIIDRFGPRVAGTEACRESAAEIRQLLTTLCDDTGSQEFTLHPGAMWNMGRIIGGCYCLSVLFMLEGGGWIWGAAAASTLSIVYWLCQLVFMVGAFDFFFKKAPGVNVWGTIEPTGEVRRQIYVVGHHDSPRIFTFLERMQKWYGVRSFAAVAFSAAQLVWVWAWVSFRFINHADPVWAKAAVITGLAGLIFLGPLIFFIGRDGSPGAGDNLVASVMGIHIARIIRGDSGTGRLRHTRLVVLSVDGEEVGMRGAAAYTGSHIEDLTQVRTSVLNFDAIYRLEDLRLITRDRNGFTPLSERMADECAEIARRLGYEIARGPVTFGGGGTDAIQFAAAGIETASIIGISTKLIREGLVYHTRHDTADRIDPRAVKACMEIAVNYIMEVDAEARRELM